MKSATLKIHQKSSKSTKNPSKIRPKPFQNPPSKKDVSKTRPKIHFWGPLNDFWWILMILKSSVFDFVGFKGVPKGPTSRTLRALFSYLFSNTLLDHLSSVCWSRDMRFARHGGIETHVGRFERGTQNPSKMAPFESQNRPKIWKICSRLNK